MQLSPQESIEHLKEIGLAWQRGEASTAAQVDPMGIVSVAVQSSDYYRSKLKGYLETAVATYEWVPWCKKKADLIKTHARSTQPHIVALADATKEFGKAIDKVRPTSLDKVKELIVAEAEATWAGQEDWGAIASEALFKSLSETVAEMNVVFSDSERVTNLSRSIAEVIAHYASTDRQEKVGKVCLQLIEEISPDILAVANSVFTACLGQPLSAFEKEGEATRRTKMGEAREAVAVWILDHMGEPMDIAMALLNSMEESTSKEQAEGAKECEFACSEVTTMLRLAQDACLARVQIEQDSTTVGQTVEKCKVNAWAQFKTFQVKQKKWVDLKADTNIPQECLQHIRDRLHTKRDDMETWMSKVSGFRFTEASFALGDTINKLDQIAHGAKEGKVWSDGLADIATIDEVMTHAKLKDGLFSISGLDLVCLRTMAKEVVCVARLVGVDGMSYGYTLAPRG